MKALPIIYIGSKERERRRKEERRREGRDLSTGHCE